MDRATFSTLSDDCLARVAKFCEPFDPDELDFATTDGVVTLEFSDRVRYVLNRQAATNQMWFAAGARAWHFNYDATKNTWVDDRDGHDLFVRIGEVVSAKLGRSVTV